MKNAQKTIDVGDYVLFGHYQQTKEVGDKSPIEWLVLEKNEGKALLISRYALDSRPFHETYDSVNWENCSIREWLNGPFYAAAFSEQEKKHLNEYVTSTIRKWQNEKPFILQVPVAKDKVFLLSHGEVLKYFPDTESYDDWSFFASTICEPTEYAKQQGAYFYVVDENCGGFDKDYNYSQDWKGKSVCNWWLRQKAISASKALLISGNGTTDFLGGNLHDSIFCVRPAIWISLNNPSLPVIAQKKETKL